jgi:hypothetical protein
MAHIVLVDKESHEGPKCTFVDEIGQRSNPHSDCDFSIIMGGFQTLVAGPRSNNTRALLLRQVIAMAVPWAQEAAQEASQCRIGDGFVVAAVAAGDVLAVATVLQIDQQRSIENVDRFILLQKRLLF